MYISCKYNSILLTECFQNGQMLPDVVSTEQQSLVLVKKLLAIAVSSITYLRGLFPEKAYGPKYVGGKSGAGNKSFMISLL